MNYRVFIPCAGTGSRLGELTHYINKSLITIANRPALSHIIEKFPQNVEFVIALGYKGYLVREFLSLAYPLRKFHLVDVNPYEGDGSGLGFSLLMCEKYLQLPFIFISCDTLVDEQIPEPKENWMAYANQLEKNLYRSIEINNNKVINIHEKGFPESTSMAYIGLAGINNYEDFWSAMKDGSHLLINTGEIHGLRKILAKNVHAYKFTWHDTGNLEQLNNTRKYYKDSNEPNILEKSDEAIWFIDNSVIKFCDNKLFISNRVERENILEGFVPTITGIETHMYKYTKVKGATLSNVITIPLFDKLLYHGKQFWRHEKLSNSDEIIFQDNCQRFYYNKTLERVELFYKKFNKKDNFEIINGKEYESVHEILKLLDWSWISSGLPGRFHGDFHFENILFDYDSQNFTFLDWRQDFGGDLFIGDIYYDFAKLLHGMIINHEIISRDLYYINWDDNNINFDFFRKQILVECEKYFDTWLENSGFDRKKVWMLTALIFLNIAALHHYPYGLLLYSLGKTMLKTELEG